MRVPHYRVARKKERIASQSQCSAIRNSSVYTAKYIVSGNAILWEIVVGGKQCTPYATYILRITVYKMDTHTHNASMC